MSGQAAVGEVFYAAFQALKPVQRDRVLARLLRDRAIQEDLFDLALIQRAQRAKGRTVDAKAFFKRLGVKGGH